MHGLKDVAIVSGGMDSVTLAYMLAETSGSLHLLSFDYGQRHSKELQFAKLAANKLGARHDVISLQSLQHLFVGSSLTDPTVDVPEGHYEAPTMVATIVPNRNSIMLNIAVGVAVAEKADLVYTGVHAGDHAVYPDCRPEFIRAMNDLIPVATESNVKVEAPFVTMSKTAIAQIGDELGVPWHETWSCYKGGDKHCGKCGTCVERLEALSLAGAVDLTEYEVRT